MFSFIISEKNHIFRWLLSQRPDLKDRINQQDRDGCTLLHIVASSSDYSRKRSKYSSFFVIPTCVVVCFHMEKMKNGRKFQTLVFTTAYKEENEKALLYEHNNLYFSLYLRIPVIPL